MTELLNVLLELGTLLGCFAEAENDEEYECIATQLFCELMVDLGYFRETLPTTVTITHELPPEIGKRVLAIIVKHKYKHEAKVKEAEK